MSKLIVELEWADDELSPGWMNIDNLKACLYSKTHINEQLCKVREISQDQPDSGEDS